MRLLTILVTLPLPAFVSCAQSREASSNNSIERSANRIESTATSKAEAQQPCVNLNTASAEELAALPGIGDVIAKRVVEYRESHGRFRRTEEIIIIEGFSERKYRSIASMICVE